MRCKYCYASAGESSNYMTADTACNLISQLSDLNKNKTIKILFHGGEPLLCFKQIMEITDFCEKKLSSKYDFYIQTNAILLDNSILAYLRTHNIKLSISLDGCDAKTNKCRELSNNLNSFDVIKNKIVLINNLGIDYNCLSVLNRYNYKSVSTVIDFFVNNNCHNFSFNYFIKSGRGIENSNLAITNQQLFVATKQILDTVHKYFKLGITLHERNTQYLVKTIVTGKKLFMCANSPCGAGLNLLGVCPNGDIYPCDDLSSQPQFKLGNIKRQSVIEILNNSTIDYFANCSYKNINECRDCRWSKFCGAGCCSRKYFENGNIYSKDPICGFYKLIIPYIQGLLKNNAIPMELYGL